MSEPSSTRPLRLLTWNVWRLFGDPLAVHRVLRAAAPDLVCLQEAPWSAWRLASLARASGLIRVAGGPAGAGTAMLRSSRVRVQDPVVFTLPRSARRPAPPGRRMARRLERRGAVLTSVGLPGAAPGGPLVRVACVHLGLDPAERLQHVEALIARLRTTALPIVVAGDLNEGPAGPVWQALSTVVADPAPQAGPTFPAAGARHRIDAVLTGPQLETVEYARWQPDRRDAALASDHLPVLSLVRFAR